MLRFFTARRKAALRLFGLAVLAMLAACAPRVAPPERLTLESVAFSDLPGWGDDRQSEALSAFLRSCPPLSKSGPSVSGADGAGPQFGTAADWAKICEDAKSVPAGDDVAARAFFEKRFGPFEAGNNGDAEGLFTGYYVPELKGSRQKSAEYRVPIYRVPDDLVTADLGLFKPDLKGVHIVGKVEKGKLKPYDNRAEIDAGALADRGFEILYVDDPIDAFFLHIQGSGRVVMEDGSKASIGYAGTNGQPYVAIGRSLADSGALAKDDVSMQSIRKWLADHPGEAEKTMEANPSYVFFRELPGDAAIGAQGVALTPERSLAVDHRFLPYGLPLWLDAEAPDAGARLRRLVIAQDTGGAIKGPVRGDFFWGFGHEAGEKAGRMKSKGRYFLLLPRGAAVAFNQ
jgi:membrane-bound lytic murein transglycosylase A